MIGCLNAPFFKERAGFWPFFVRERPEIMAICLQYGKRYEDEHAFFDNPVPFRFIQLHQVGELSCEVGYEVEPHRQQVYEITYVVSGKGTVITDGEETPVQENSVIINLPDQMHAIRADRGTPLRFCYIGFTFTGRREPELERFYRSWNSAEPLCCKGLIAPFAAIFDELYQQQDFHMMMVGIYAERLVVDVYRSHDEQRARHRPSIAENRAGGAAYMVARYIDTHYRDIDDMRELAARLGYSYTYLAHIFKDKMGVTIGSYILDKKMEEAKWLLRSGRMTVSQIATRFGYRSVQSFSNSFKKAVGVSPAEYQALPAEEAETYN